jgi:hypothetical protein
LAGAFADDDEEEPDFSCVLEGFIGCFPSTACCDEGWASDAASVFAGGAELRAASAADGAEPPACAHLAEAAADRLEKLNSKPAATSHQHLRTNRDTVLIFVQSRESLNLSEISKQH